MRRKDRERSDPAWQDETLRRADVCHLALTDGDWPYVVALNYGFYRDAAERLVLYFHCAKAGKKLDLLRLSDKAAFFVDCGHELVTGDAGCDWGMKYRSVAGRGRLRVVTDADEKKRGLDLLLEHHSGRTGFSYDERVFAATEVLALEVEAATGKMKA